MQKTKMVCPNLLHYYYTQAREWYTEVQQAIQSEIDDYDQILQSMPDEFHLDELIIQDTHLKEHYHREKYAQYLYHAKRNLLTWTIQVHREIETTPFEPEKEALLQSIMHDPMYRVAWSEMCEKALQGYYPYVVAFPDQELIEARQAVMVTRAPENTTGRVLAIAIELVQVEGGTGDLERRMLMRNGYYIAPLLSYGSPHVSYTERYHQSDELWIRANDLLRLWTKEVESGCDKVEYGVLFADGSTHGGVIEVGPEWEEQTLLHDQIRNYCGFYSGRRQPQRMHKEQYHSFIQCAEKNMAEYVHILDECQVGPEERKEAQHAY